MSTSGVAAFLGVVLSGCSSALPHPPEAPQPSDAFVDVPYPPPAGHVETVPARPSRTALWIDGQWSWDGERWEWRPGGWVAPDPGARFARWQIRIQADGQLRFAGASWRDAGGHLLRPPHVLVTASGEETSESTPVQCP
jgi:hypothetical protein